MGGTQKKTPTYKQVSTGKTGHTESVKVVYDPSIVSYSELVDYFFSIHDPTTKNKQGSDVGTQYRSIAFYSNKKEKQIIQSFIKQSIKPIVTEVKQKSKFTKAEKYHQDYSQKKQTPSTENLSMYNKVCINNTTKAEPTFTGKYNHTKYLQGLSGIYSCPRCGNKLYKSDDAFDSRSGWPAFSDTIDNKALSNTSEHILYNPVTKELTCKKCDLHLGHRFITGKKIHDCVNSVCLHFTKLTKGGFKKTKNKQFLFNPNNPKKSFDVYIDKDPSDTIPIKYTTLQDVKYTIKKLERLYKQGKYTHKRIWQVGMILYVRLKVLKKKKKQHFILAESYFKHLGKRTKLKDDIKRKRFTFKI